MSLEELAARVTEARSSGIDKVLEDTSEVLMLTECEKDLYNFAATILETLHTKRELRQRVVELEAEVKKYKNLFESGLNRPHPAEGLLTLIANGNVSLHSSEK